MHTLVRRLRGLLGMGLIWGVGYGAFMAVLWTIIRIMNPGSIEPSEGILRIAGIVGGVGFLSGVLFGGLMSLAETRKKILELSLTRAAVWGMAGAAAFPLLTDRISQLIWIIPLGAIFSSGTVALARRAERRELTRGTDSAYTLDVP